LQIPASGTAGVVTAVSWLPATRAVCSDVTARSEVAAGPVFAAGADFAAGTVFAAGIAAAAGADFAAGAALAERDMKSPLSTIAMIAPVNSRARAGR
jgi:hypothetical protein